MPHLNFVLPVPSHFLSCAVTASILTTALFLGWTTLRKEARKLLESSPSSSGIYLFWLAFYSGTVAVLASLLTHRFGTGLSPAAYFLTTILLTLTAAATWCLAAMPGRFWWNWLSTNPQVLPTAAVAGALTYFGGHHLTSLVVTNSQQLILPLQRLTLRLVAILLGVVSNNVVFEPETFLIGTGSFSVLVDIQCAGWEGIGLFVTLFSIYVWFYRRDLRFPQVLMLLPVGALIVWLCNALRIFLLVLIGSFWPFIAIEGFHSVAGWLFFDGITLALVAVSRHLQLFTNTPASGDAAAPTTSPNVAAPYLAPLMIIIATSMITRVFFDGFDLLYPLRLVFGGAALWFYRSRLPLRWNVSWPAVALGFLAFAVWLALPQGDPNIATDATLKVSLDRLPLWGRAVWISCRAFTAIAVIPVAEEVAFRGYLLRKLVSSDFEKVPLGYFTWFSFLVCSVLFGSLHARWLAGCVAGMIFAVAIYRRGLLFDAVVSHGIANGLLTVYVLATHQWSLWT